MKIYDKNLKAHKITNIIYLVILIPCLLLAILSAFIIYNTKQAGGYANIFGYYVVEIPSDNNNFYDGETDAYKPGTKQIFKATATDNIKKGDIVVCYSGEAERTISNVASGWITFSATANTYSSDTASEIKVVKIGDQKAIYSGQYIGFSYYESEGSEQIIDLNNVIMAEDIIGVAVPTNAFIANAIDFGKEVSCLLLFILLPCVVLLLIKFLSLMFYKKYEEANQVKRNGKIINDERKSHEQTMNVNRSQVGVPQRPTRVASINKPANPPKRVVPQRPAGASKTTNNKQSTSTATSKTTATNKSSSTTTNKSTSAKS